METSTCPKCGKELPAPTNVCSSCGKQIERNRNRHPNTTRPEGCLSLLVWTVFAPVSLFVTGSLMIS